MIGAALLLTVLACMTIAVYGRYGGVGTQDPIQLGSSPGSHSQHPAGALGSGIGAETISYLQSFLEPTAASEAKPDDEPLSKMKINSTVMWLEDHESLIGFYTEYTGSTQVSAIILEVALVLDIPINIAFSLAWKESRYNPKAISARNRGGSRDWGLFQLNDRGRGEWTEQEFFNLRKNTYSGLYYLKHCIDTMGEIRMGLAAYNAGVYGIKTKGIPRSTRRYIDAILAYEAILDEAFTEWVYEKGTRRG